MTTLSVKNREGVEVDTYEIDTERFAPRISKQLLHDVVVMYQANRRLGSAKTKNRAEVAGSTRKLYRQKGTGNARAGSRRSNIRRGGGHAFAKTPREFGYRLPRKAVRAATRMAVASKILDDEVVLIDELSFDEPSTRDLVAILKALDVEGTVLVVTDGIERNVYLSGRNIPGVEVTPIADLNALSVLRPRYMLMPRAALDALQERWSSAARADAEPAAADA